jgi:hypothetical protein
MGARVTREREPTWPANTDKPVRRSSKRLPVHDTLLLDRSSCSRTYPQLFPPNEHITLANSATMFGIPGVDIPFRSRKDLARAQHLRGITRRRHGHGGMVPPMPIPHMPPMPDDFWMATMPMMSQGPRRPDSFSRNPGSGFRRFEEVLEDPPARPAKMPPMHPNNIPFDFGYGYGSPPAKKVGNEKNGRGIPHHHYHAGAGKEAVPFDAAADALCQALQFAVRHCKGILEQFDAEIAKASIAAWAPPKVVDALWAMRLEWDGVDLAEAEKNPNLSSKRSTGKQDTVTYTEIVKRVLGAREDFKTCARPQIEWLEEVESTLSPEVFKNTMKKLEVTMSGVEKLMQSVRKDRALMEPLVKDLMAATSLLEDIEDLWVPARKHAAGKGGRTRWEDDEYDWVDE